MPSSSRKSYSLSLKLRAVDSLKNAASISAVATEFGVSRSMIRAWRDQEDQLRSLAKREKKHGDGIRRRRRVKYRNSPKFEDMEGILVEWIKEMRQAEVAVHGKAICKKAKDVMEELYPGENVPFATSKGWLSRFLRRQSLVSRRVTSVGQELPGNAQAAAKTFLKDVRGTIVYGDLAPVAVGNMDESPFWFDLPSSESYDFQGLKTIKVKTTGYEKMRFTVVLTALANGTKLKPMVIFKNLKNVPKGDFPRNCVITVAKGGCMTTELMQEWMAKVWQSRPGSIFRKPAVLVLDKHRSHTHADTVSSLQRRYATQSQFIPGGMTSLLQPCDVSWNKSMKSKVRKSWNEWLEDGEQAFTRTGKRKRASYDTVAKWVVEAWEQVPRDLITNSFVKCGLTPSDSIDILHDPLKSLIDTGDLPEDVVTSGEEDVDGSDMEEEEENDSSSGSSDDSDAEEDNTASDDDDNDDHDIFVL